MSIILTNFYESTIAATFGSGSTSLQVASTANLPGSIGAGNYMPLTIQDAATGQIHEIVKVTAITGSTLTVVRGAEGTTPQNWSVGDIVAVTPTAGTTATVGQAPFYGADSGAVNAYASAITGITAYAGGLFLGINIANTNTTTTPTLNINALGAKTIVRLDGSAIAAGDLIANGVSWFSYDGTNMQLLNPRTSVAPSKNYNSGTSQGHIDLPGGWILNFGQANTVGSQTASVTFDKPFTTTSLAIVWTVVIDDASVYATTVDSGSGQPSTTTLTGAECFTNITSTVAINYFCLGY